MGLESILPLALSGGAKLFGGAGGSGASPAANTGPSPFTAGLLGQQPPVPSPNENFHAGQVEQLAKAIPLPDRNSLFQPSPEEQDVLDRLKAGRAGGAPGQQMETITSQEVPMGSAPGKTPLPAQAQPVLPVQQARGLLDVQPEPPASVAPAAGIDPTAPVQGSTSQAQPAASGGLFGDIRKSVHDAVNPLQTRLKDAATNPLLQMGLGLLASGYDRNVNPYLAMQRGLGAIPGAGLTQAQGNKAQTEAGNEAATLAAIKALIASGAIPGMTQPGGTRQPASASGEAT